MLHLSGLSQKQSPARFLQSAHGRLDKAQAVLELEGRGKHLKAIHAQVVGRRCRMVAALGGIFKIGPLTGGHTTCHSWENQGQGLMSWW